MSLTNELTVIMPAYNEEKGIKTTLNKLLTFAIKYHWDVIVVDDGSNDSTADIIKEIQNISIIKHKNNKGYGAALKSGIILAKTKYIAMYDSDGQHNPEDLLALANNMKDYDMLIGQRGKDSHQSIIRKPGKWVLKIVANFLTKRKIPDLNSGLRIIRREIIINKLHLFSDSFSFSTTSTVGLMSLGHYVEYFPIVVNKRAGKSSVNQLKHGSNTILLIIRLIMLFNPLRIFIPTSLLLFFFGLLYEFLWGVIFIDGLRIISGALILIITSVIVFFFGLIADQIAEIRKNQIPQ